MKNKVYLRLILLAALAFGLSSCGVWYNLKAYFNAYYNAKVIFDQVESNIASQANTELFSYREPTIQAQDYLLLNKVNDKCSKILQFDTQSGYFIDALWLSGKSFYYQKEYVKAERKFKELLNIERDSVKLVEVNLWLGKTELQMRNFNEGIKLLDKVAKDAIKYKEDDLFTIAVIKQISYLIYKEQYPEAIEKCNEFVKNSKDSEKKAEVAYELGKFYYKNSDYEKASAAFKSVSDFSPTFETGFRSKLEYAKCIMDMGKLDEGMSLLTDLKNKSQYSKYLNEISVELGTGYYLKKDYAKAMDIFTSTDTLYYGTKSSGVAEYMKAQIYEYHIPNFDSAAAYYETANQNGLLGDEMRTQISKKSFIFASYIEKRNDIIKNRKQILYKTDKSNFLRDSVLYVEMVYRDTLGQKLKMQQGGQNQTLSPNQLVQNQSNQDQTGSSSQSTQDQQNSLSSQSNQSSMGQPNQQGQKLGLSSSQTQTNAGNSNKETQKRMPKKKALPPKPELVKITKDSLTTNLSNKLFTFGNMLFADMDLPDSAIYYYNEILASYPQKPLARDAYYALGTVYSTMNQKEKADSLFKIVYENYKDSPLGVMAAKKLGLIEEAPKNDPAEVVYIEAEKKYYNKNYTEAINEFRTIPVKYPKSRFAPRAAFYVAFIFENDIKNLDSTTTAYEYLTGKFPDSDAAKKAQKHYTVYLEEKNKKAKEDADLQKQALAANAATQKAAKDAKTDTRPKSDLTVESPAKLKEGKLPAIPSGKVTAKDSVIVVPDSVKAKHARFKDDLLLNQSAVKDTLKDKSKVVSDSIKIMMEKARVKDALKEKQKKIVDSLRAVKYD
jgi:TolA-binding protein